MTIFIAFLTVIVWPCTIYWVISLLVSSVDNHLKERHNQDIKTKVENANKELSLQVSEVESKLLKLQENVTIIQNGLQWKK